MPRPAGRNMALSLPRRLACDLSYFAQRIPSVPVQRRMNLTALEAARSLAQPQPSWHAIFAKAFGMVAESRAELRRAFFSFPWSHLYEHPVSVASLAIESRLGDEDAMLFTHVESPEQQSLVQVDAELGRYREQPIENFITFQRALRISRLPGVIRRWVWRFILNLSGQSRARALGTFGLCSFAHFGAIALHPLTPLSYTLSYGVVEANGMMDVRITYDHRVTDGAQVARILRELERVLNCEILSELRYLQAKDAA
jgi:hypothetical protein